MVPQVHAVRDTQLAQIPKSAVMAVARNDPMAMLSLGQAICEDVIRDTHGAEPVGGGDGRV